MAKPVTLKHLIAAKIPDIPRIYLVSLKQFIAALESIIPVLHPNFSAFKTAHSIEFIENTKIYGIAWNT